MVTGFGALATLIFPYSHLASVLGFSVLPPAYLGTILAIVAIYIISVELTKLWFYKLFRDHG